MRKERDVSLLDDLIEQIFTKIKEGRTPISSAGVVEGSSRRALKHYRACLRKFFERSEIGQLVQEGRSIVWPNLNSEPFQIGPPREFVNRWAHLGIDFKLAHMPSAQGLALMGFYVKRTPNSRRPLICVNTAHHPAAIGAAFSHEMGHHLTAEIFDVHEEPARFLLYTGYAEHLSDPVELAADILVSFGTFPLNAAKQLFGNSRKNPANLSPYETEMSSRTIVDYFRHYYGLDFNKMSSNKRTLQYLAGVIHYCRLRQAILDEYDL